MNNNTHFHALVAGASRPRFAKQIRRYSGRPTRLLAKVALCAVALLTTSTANAALTYAYTTPTSSINLFPGYTTSVPVYLRETSTAGSPSLLAAHGGLFSTGLRADRLTGSNIAISATTANPAFPQVKSLTLLPNQARFLEANLAANVPSTDLGNGIRELLVGTLTFTATPATLGSSTFRIADFDLNGPSADTLTGLGTTLDTNGSATPASTTLTLVAIPEPSAAALLGAAALVPLLRRRR